MATILTTITIATLAVAAAAQPHHHHHRHLHQHKRAVDLVTDIVYTTEAAAVVYVNQAGSPISTSYVAPTPTTQALVAATPSPTSPATSAFIPSAPEGTTSLFIAPAPETSHSSAFTPTPESNQSPTTSAPTSATSSATSSGSSINGDTSSFGYGLSYSPYNSDNSCKSQDQINDDFTAFSGYGFIRSYGTDCNQASTILSAVQAKGMKMFAGIYDVGSAASEAQTLISAVGDNWNDIYAVSVGNEAVNDGVATVSQVVAAVNQVRSMLRAAGYNGPVVTVDTCPTIIANPELCGASDFAASNCHAFFDADITADQAGAYVLDQKQRIQQACGGKDTMITESGWPNQGDDNGSAVPSPQNQVTAIQSLREAFPNNIVLFSAFNDLWETNTPATFGTNQFWGIYGNAPSSS